MLQKRLGETISLYLTMSAKAEEDEFRSSNFEITLHAIMLIQYTSSA